MWIYVVALHVQICEKHFEACNWIEIAILGSAECHRNCTFYGLSGICWPCCYFGNCVCYHVSILLVYTSSIVVGSGYDSFGHEGRRNQFGNNYFAICNYRAHGYMGYIVVISGWFIFFKLYVYWVRDVFNANHGLLDHGRVCEHRTCDDVWSDGSLVV